jgi:phosphate transport system substrate-binding protein
VAANVRRIKGSIGYVEYAYVKKNNMVHMKLQNKDGNFVDPDDTSFAAAAAGADWFSVPGMGLSIVEQPGKNTWPVSTASFIIMYKDPVNKKESQEAIKFFDWAFKNGAKMSEELDYVHLPESLQNEIRKRVWSQINH